MQKFTAGCLVLVAALVFVSAACFVGNGSLGEKHTGPVTVRNESSRGAGVFEFIRANGELFEMSFDPDYLGPNIHKGDVLGDLSYTDTKNHRAFFVKATLLKEAEPLPQPDKVFSSGEVTCGGGYNGCRYDSTIPMWRWKDGAYREKPEPKK